MSKQLCSHLCGVVMDLVGHVGKDGASQQVASWERGVGVRVHRESVGER